MKLIRQSDSDYEERSADKENGADKPAKSKSHGLKSMSVVAKSAAQKFSPKTVRKKHKASVAVMKVYPSELVCYKLAFFYKILGEYVLFYCLVQYRSVMKGYQH